MKLKIIIIKNLNDSALKRKEIQMHAIIWIKFKNIMLSNMSHFFLKKGKYSIIPLI